MSKRLLLPCLRGAIGNWVTYTCLMRLDDIAMLVSFADDVHKSKRLCQMIQRELSSKRREEIGEYLLNDDEAFFNSLVVAVYDGEPQWHQFDAIKGNTDGYKNFEIHDYANESLGYLSLTREERIFALDGQHRLSGIRYALEKNPELGFKQLPVVFLPHFNDDKGLKRTRRLFTTLNKRAKPVDKSAIITLDEDDLAACAARFIVEDSSAIPDSFIKFKATNTVGYTDNDVLTTIGNLYDVLKLLLNQGLGVPKPKLGNFRGKEDEKQQLFEVLENVFGYFTSAVPEIHEFITAPERRVVADKYRRKDNGGHFLFRPAGLLVFFDALCKYAKKRKLDEISFENAAYEFIDATISMDLAMEGEILRDRIWDMKRKSVIKLKAEDRNFITQYLVNAAEQFHHSA